MLVTAIKLLFTKIHTVEEIHIGQIKKVRIREKPASVEIKMLSQNVPLQ